MSSPPVWPWLGHPVLHRPRERPLFMAHRGGAREAPESTRAAFDNALAHGCDVLEIDVHATRDGELVVCHDPTVDRTTDGRGALADLTLDRVKALDAGWSFSNEQGAFPYRGRGLRLLTLDEALSEYTEVRWNIDVKVDDLWLADRVLDTLARHGAVERTCLASFHGRVMSWVRAQCAGCATSAPPGVVLAAIWQAGLGGSVDGGGFDVLQIPERLAGLRMVSEWQVARYHAAGLAVHVWVVDDASDVQRLRGWGVDGLMTDCPRIFDVELP